METIVFDGREAARPVRNDPTIKPFLADSDDARTGTVTFKSNTPERVINEVAGEAAETREKEAEKYGQVPLTDEERKQIDFTKTSVPAARSAKGIAAGKGVDDFLSFFDAELTVDENREIFERAKREDGGKRNEGRETGSNAKRLAKANKRRKAEQGDRIRQYALVEQDRDAQSELESQPGGVGDLFDIGFSRGEGGRLFGSGEDFGRLEERHSKRSKRAQRVDERRAAKVTRDPVQWANNPGQFDFPGIDTIEPQKIHDQRSKRAQEVDERELAPPADTKEQWAQNQDEYDWPGVDTPPGMRLGPGDGEVPEMPDMTPSLPDASLAVQEGPSTAKEKERTLMSELQQRDVSVSPDELFGGVGVVSSAELGGNVLGEGERSPSNLTDPPQSAINAQSSGDGLMSFADDRPENSQLLDFGMETDATQNRESRQDVESATTFGVDDRSDEAVFDNSNESEQQGFEVFGGGVRENETLF